MLSVNEVGAMSEDVARRQRMLCVAWVNGEGFLREVMSGKALSIAA